MLTIRWANQESYNLVIVEGNCVRVMNTLSKVFLSLRNLRTMEMVQSASSTLLIVEYCFLQREANSLFHSLGKYVAEHNVQQ